VVWSPDGGWVVASGVETDPPGYEESFLRPRSGDDATFEVVDGAVGALGLARGLWMGDDRVMIHLVASVIEQAERFLPYLVAEARAEGAPWEEIARLLGIDVEQARARFDPASPVADTRSMWDA
jgi:hypothetical protein